MTRNLSIKVHKPEKFRTYTAIASSPICADFFVMTSEEMIEQDFRLSG